MFLELEHIKLLIVLFLEHPVDLDPDCSGLCGSTHLIYGPAVLLLRRKLITVKCSLPEQAIYDRYSHKCYGTYRKKLLYGFLETYQTYCHHNNGHHKDSDSHYDKYIICQFLILFLLLLLFLLVVLVIYGFDFQEYPASLPVFILVRDIRILLIYQLSGLSLQSGDLHIIGIEFFSSCLSYILQILVDISQLIHLSLKLFYLSELFLVVIFLSLIFKISYGFCLIDSAASGLPHIHEISLKAVTYRLVIIPGLCRRLDAHHICKCTLVHVKEHILIGIPDLKSLLLATLHIREACAICGHVKVAFKQIAFTVLDDIRLAGISICTLRLSSGITVTL